MDYTPEQIANDIMLSLSIRLLKIKREKLYEELGKTEKQIQEKYGQFSFSSDLRPISYTK